MNINSQTIINKNLQNIFEQPNRMEHTQRTQTQPVLTPKLNDQITTAAQLLRDGGVVAFPTETVYGLGADISISSAVHRIFKIKGRPTDHPLIVHIANTSQLEYWAQEIPESAWQLAEHFWPGPLTLILRRSRHVPKIVTGGQDTVGLRIPAHPVARTLIEKLGSNRALAAPSANRFGKLSPTTAAHVREDLGQTVDMILDGGACKIGLESTIVSFNSQKATVLRPGGTPLAALEDVLNGQVITVGEKNPIIRTPGSHASHYAPNTPLEIFPTKLIWQHAINLATQGLRTVILEWSASKKNQNHSENNHILQFSMPHEPITYGRQLYATLRRFDHKDFDRLLVEAPPNDPAWLAIADRLQRASTPSS